MQILAQQPVGIAKILDSSFKLYAASFSKLIGYGLIVSALYIISTVLIASLLGGLPSGAPEDALGVMVQVLPAMMGCFFVVSVVSFILYAAMIYRIDNTIQQREDSFAEALLFGVKKFPVMFMALLIYGLAVSVGSMLLVVPGVILMLSLSFYPFLIVLEDQGGYESLKSSHELVWGNWWRTLSVYMAPGILMIVLFSVIGFLSAAIGDTSQPGSVGATDIISDLLYAVIMPYFYSLGYVLYHDLKLRKAGGDLAARLAQ